MKNLLILILICSLSGCGVFKKTFKEIDKHSEMQVIESTIQSNVEYQDNSKSLAVNTSISTEISTNGYTVKAKAIKLNADGSIEAVGDAQLSGSNTLQKESKDSSAMLVEADVKAKQEIQEESKQVLEVKDYAKQTKSETDAVGLLFGALAAIIIVIGVMWWMGLKRNVI